ncbi:hypothetical protein [Nocardia sp. NBC_00511]|uniref:hypothetical protein n=1 Tax=Nocardia sp. NBC_00511 TaxID=2903591 RepID=UPI0030E3D4E7
MTLTPMKMAVVAIVSAGIGLSALGTAAASPLPCLDPIAGTGSAQQGVQPGTITSALGYLLCAVTGGHPVTGMAGPTVCEGGQVGSL